MNDQMDLFEPRGLNDTIWVWEASWKPWSKEINTFNFRFGPNTGDNSNQFLDVIKEYWKKNTLLPKKVIFNRNN